MLILHACVPVIWEKKVENTQNVDPSSKGRHRLPFAGIRETGRRALERVGKKEDGHADKVHFGCVSQIRPNRFGGEVLTRREGLRSRGNNPRTE